MDLFNRRKALVARHEFSHISADLFTLPAQPTGSSEPTVSHKVENTISSLSSCSTNATVEDFDPSPLATCSATSCHDKKSFGDSPWNSWPYGISHVDGEMLSAAAGPFDSLMVSASGHVDSVWKSCSSLAERLSADLRTSFSASTRSSSDAEVSNGLLSDELGDGHKSDAFHFASRLKSDNLVDRTQCEETSSSGLLTELSEPRDLDHEAPPSFRRTTSLPSLTNCTVGTHDMGSAFEPHIRRCWSMGDIQLDLSLEGDSSEQPSGSVVDVLRSGAAAIYRSAPQLTGLFGMTKVGVGVATLMGGHMVAGVGIVLYGACTLAAAHAWKKNREDLEEETENNSDAYFTRQYEQARIAAPSTVPVLLPWHCLRPPETSC